MQLSHYLKIYPYEEKPGHLLFFSTRKGSTALLRIEDYESIKKGAISPADGEILLKLGIVVPDREAEKASMLSILDTMNKNSTGLNVTVVLNLDCNFACTYCYEGELKGKLYMSDETAHSLVRFIKERFKANKKSINLDFYGGEPLLSPDIIKAVSRDLKSFAESRGAAYTFTLITNGSLYKRQLVEELAALGLQSVKITVDGPAEVHDKCRPFKSGVGSFDVIMRNIRETHDLAKIGIGGNFLQDNYEQFPLLLDRLQKENLGPGKISVIKFDPVMNRFDGAGSRIDYTDGVMSVNEPWAISAGNRLREEILKRGFNTPKITPMPCQVELDDYFIVNFDGMIYKCPAFIGRAGFEIGNLESGTRDYGGAYKLGHWKNDECRECEYLPLCFGGCRHLAYLRNSEITVDCKKPYLDASLETLVKQDVKYRKPAGVA